MLERSPGVWSGTDAAAHKDYRRFSRIPVAARYDAKEIPFFLLPAAGAQVPYPNRARSGPESAWQADRTLELESHPPEVIARRRIEQAPPLRAVSRQSQVAWHFA